MGNNYVSRVISFKRDIAPEKNRFIQIYAGVGSGKNSFIEKLISGYIEELPNGERYEVKPQTVLLITSRRAKVNETLTEDDIDAAGSVGAWGNMHQILQESDNLSEYEGYVREIEDDLGDIRRVYQKSVVCTNAFIEKYLQYAYVPADPMTHLWNLFDIIVVDEIHSLVLDATYQSAPFYVLELMSEFMRRRKAADENPETAPKCLCKHLVLMTGSPDPMENLRVTVENPVKLDLMSKCKNVVPKNIFFITATDAKKKIEKQLRAGEKVVYFTNEIVMPEAFCAGTDIDRGSVTVSFSEDEKRRRLKKEDAELYRRMVEAEESLARESMLPESVRLFLTTSRNKEGININNHDIKNLYVESHIRSDVIQMAGRIRDGVEDMYVVIDAVRHKNPEWEYEADFTSRMITAARNREEQLDAANVYLQFLCEKFKIKGLYGEKAGYNRAYAQGNEVIARYIDYIHKKFPYVRYSFLRNKFCYYKFRRIGVRYQEKYEKLFNKGRYDSRYYAELLQEWFPSSVVHLYLTPESRAENYMETQLEKRGSNIFSEAEIEEICAALNQIYRTSIEQKRTLLNRCGYSCKRRSGNKKSPAYRQWVVQRNVDP